MSLEEVSQKLLSQQEALRALGVGTLFVFGSTANGTATCNSDVDVFFDPADPRLSLFDVMAVRDTLEATLGCRADVATRSSLHPYLRARIERTAQRIF